jgi:hypothetical protein
MSVPDDLLATASPWRVPVSSALMRAVAAGHAIGQSGGELADVSLARGLGLLGGRAIDRVLPVRAPGSCLAAAEVTRAGADIVAVEIAEPRPDDAAITGFAISGDHAVCEHRYARHALLPLCGSDEAFLERLGYHTRRNVRNFRRKADAAGMTFTINDAPPSAIGRAARHQLGAITPPNGRAPALLDRYDAFLRARTDCVTASIRDFSGALIALTAAFVVGESAYIVYQLHEHDRKLSWSLVMRSWLARALIERGVVEMIFPNGCLGLLAAACEPQEIAILTFVRRNPLAALRAASLARRAPAHPASEPLRHAWAHLGATGRVEQARAVMRAVMRAV